MKLSIVKFTIIFAAVIFASCLQADYEEPLLDYTPPVPGPIKSNAFTIESGSNMLIATIIGGAFQDKLSAGQFELTVDAIAQPLFVPLRDSDMRVIFSFPASIPAGTAYFTVTRAALKDAASRVTVQAVKSGQWTPSSDVQGAFGASLVQDIAYGRGKFIAAGGDGKMAYSDDGITWTAMRPGSGTMQTKFEDTIRGIAWGDNKFVAVGYDSRMGSSDDGTSWFGWTESMFGGSSILAITYGGGRFIAGGEKGKIIYLNDGGNWTSAGDSRFGEKSIIALAHGNPGTENIYVAGGSEGQIAWSNDGSFWNYSDSSPNFGGTTINSIAYGNGCFVAVCDSGKIARSANGKDWDMTGSTAFGSSGVLSVTFGSGIFIAAGHNGKMARSSDGINWTPIAPGTGPDENKFASDWQIRAAAYGGGKFAAAGHPYTQDNVRIVYSYQAPHAVSAPSDVDTNTFDVHAGDNRLKIIMNSGRFTETAAISNFTVTNLGGGGIGAEAISGAIAERSDTQVVIRLNTPVISAAAGLRIRISADAIELMPSSAVTVTAEKSLTWSVAGSNPFGTSGISAFAHNGARYVAVGAGKIATSTDGQNWTEVTAGKGDWYTNESDYVIFRDIVYGDGRFIAVGHWTSDWGVSAVSTDGLSWSVTDKTMSTGTDSAAVYGIAHNGQTGAASRYVAVGQWGRSAYSQYGISWTMVQINSFNYLDNPSYFENVYSVAYGDGKFVAAGGNGKAAFSDDDGASWKWVSDMLLGNENAVRSVHFSNGKFIAAGDSGSMKIVSSGDVVQGTTTNGGDNWQGVDGKFGSSGILSIAHNGIAGTNGKLIAAGRDGKMSESQDGANWTPIYPGAGPDQNKFSNMTEQITCIIGVNGKFIAGGNAYSGNQSKLTYSD